MSAARGEEALVRSLAGAAHLDPVLELGEAGEVPEIFPSGV